MDGEIERHLWLSLFRWLWSLSGARRSSGAVSVADYWRQGLVVWVLKLSVGNVIGGGATTATYICAWEWDFNRLIRDPNGYFCSEEPETIQTTRKA